jgi:xylulokinase
VVEQRPDDWAEAVEQVATRLLAKAGEGVDVCAIALSGQMQDVVLVADGAALRPALLYSDVRASSEAQEIERKLGRDHIAATLDNYKGAASCLAKWLWLARHEARSLKAADVLLLGAHSYVAYRLTGGKAATDLTTASTTGLLHRGGSSGPRWANDEIGAFVGLDVSLLPHLPTSREVNTTGPRQLTAPLGRVTEGAVSDLGLPRQLAGVPVFHGVGDVASTTIGATGLGAGGAYLYLGTSGWVATCVCDDDENRMRKGDGLFNLLHAVPGLCTLAASMTTAGGNVEWAKKLLLPPGGSLADFDNLARCAPAASGGALYMPHVRADHSSNICQLLPPIKDFFTSDNTASNKSLAVLFLMSRVAYQAIMNYLCS